MDCQKLEKESATAKELLQECRNTRKKLADEVRSLTKRVKELEIKLPKLSMEIAGCDTTRAELTKLIPELRKQCDLSKDDANKLKELQKKVEKCKTDMASCAKLASKLEAEVARLQKAILDAGGPRLKKQQQACQKALANLDATEKTLKAAKVTVISSEKAVKKACKLKELAEKQLHDCVNLLHEKEEEHKALEQDALNVKHAFDKVKILEEEKREALEAVTKECDELRQSQSEIKVVEVELVGQIDALKKQLRETSNKKQHWEKELSKLRAAAEEDDEYMSDDEDNEEPPHESDLDGDGDKQMPDVDQNATIPGEKNALPVYPPESLDRYDKEEIKENIQILENERNSIAKNANMGAIAEYRRKEADYLARYVTAVITRMSQTLKFLT